MEGRRRYLRRGGRGQAKQLSEAAAAAEESDGGVRRGEVGRRVEAPTGGRVAAEVEDPTKQRANV